MKWLESLSLHPAHKSGQTIWLWLLIGTAAVAMSALPIASYRSYSLQSFDLGNMSQAIWSVTQGLPLVFTTEGLDWSRLGYHVELFYLLLVPLYTLWPSPETLLIVESVLYAVAGFPLYHLALRHLNHTKAALMLTAVYLLYPVAQTAVLFQFHGDTLAMPLLIFALEALDRRAWRSYGLWLLLALSCKFYVVIPVGALGFVLWWQGQRRAGWWTMGAAVGWLLLVFLVIRPYFAPAEPIQAVASTTDYLNYYFLEHMGEIRYTILLRLANGLIAFAPVVLLAWRAPLWLLPAVAITLPILLSSGPGPSYDYRYHHYALAVPFLMAAAVYGAGQMRQAASGQYSVTSEQYAVTKQVWYGRIRLTFIFTLILSALLVNTPLSPLFYITSPGSGRGLEPTGYGITDRDRFKDAWLARYVPADVPLMADDRLGTRLMNRRYYYRTQLQFRTAESLLPRVDYVVVDGLNDFVLGQPDWIAVGGVTAEHDTIALLMADDNFRLQLAQDGLLLFSRQAPGLRQEATVQTLSEEAEPLAQFGDQIALLNVQVEPAAPYRSLFHYDWLALTDLTILPAYFAVTRPEGLDHARILHLPSLALAPTTTWTEGTVIRETFEITWPPDTPAGHYELYVGWYDGQSLFAADTDSRSRLGYEVLAGWLEIP
jgi:uncharacterized membrane protein